MSTGSLWVTRRTVTPRSRTRACRPARSVFTSGGVSTEVGSSRIRIFAPPYRALRISTHCRSPSESCHTLAPRSTVKPYRLHSASTSRRAPRRLRKPPPRVQCPLVGLHQPEQDVHQRGLACPVLTQDRVDIARLDLEVHVVEGEHPREALRDAPGREDGFRRGSVSGQRQRHVGTPPGAVRKGEGSSAAGWANGGASYPLGGNGRSP